MDPRVGLDSWGNSRPLTGIRCLDLPARSQSLYLLRYPAHMYHQVSHETVLRCATHTQCVYVEHMDLRTSSVYFHTQH